ncbi:hypothetical protein SAMN06297280_1412 [Arsukibacterium tuosuense]|uniref:DUF3592 domain-containing protein n=1 Tax=Arsukibacterium tuosuense TaxID=1323745 RepID=A0A285ING9_9GAMM|nr:hypothetical protein [Arsukibacterium tuosuense]SNY49433.1 hypothetical protein SAMN06297280_1412 [Arsukibacterium tuosuense]
MQETSTSKSKPTLPLLGLGFLSLFMLAGVAGGIAFLVDGQFTAGLIFMTMFCGIAGLLMYLLLYGHRKLLAEQAMLQGVAPPDGILSNNKSGYQVVLGMGVVFFAIGVPISYLALSDELPKGNYAALLVLLFPLIGALLMWQGRSKLQHWQKIGKTPFFPEPVPGCAGGQVGGYFTLQHGRFRQMPQAQLSCVHIYQSGSGKNRRTHRQSIWVQQCNVSQQVDGKHWLLVDVPEQQPATGQHSDYRGRIEWQLSCKGELQQGRELLAFSRQWTLPVVAGTSRSAWQPSASEIQLQQQQRLQQASSSATSQIVQQLKGNTLHLSSRAGRHTMMALSLMLFGIVFSGAGVFLTFKALDEGGMLWLMALLFTPIGGGILLLGLFWLGRSLEASITPGEVRTLRKMFGIRLYQRQATVSNLEQLQIKKTMTSSNSDGENTEYYRLQVATYDKNLILAEGIIGRDAAEVLKQKVAEVLIR